MLCKYALNKNKNRDFELLLLYPAIIELRIFYNIIKDKTESYKDLNTLRDLSEITEINKLIKEVDNPSDLSSERILALWNDITRKRPDIGEILEVSTPIGSTFLIERSFRRLRELIDSETIKLPEKVKVLCDYEPEIDKGIYDSVFKNLSEKRNLKSKMFSNIMDAMLAGMSFNLDSKIKSENMAMAVHTGSPIPAKVLQEIEASRNGWMVRTPINFMLRMLPSNESKDYLMDDFEFYSATREMAEILAPYEDVENIIQEEKKKVLNLSDAQLKRYFYTRAQNSITFLRSFHFYDGFENFFIDAIKSNRRETLQKWLFYEEIQIKQQKLEKLARIKLSAEYLEKLQEFENAVSKTHEMLLKNTKELFSFYVKSLREHDPSKVSIQMREYYNFLKYEPKK